MDDFDHESVWYRGGLPAWKELDLPDGLSRPLEIAMNGQRGPDGSKYIAAVKSLGWFEAFEQIIANAIELLGGVPLQESCE
jgi:hypothetical protein